MRKFYIKLMEYLWTRDNITMSKASLNGKLKDYYLVFINVDKYVKVYINIWYIYTSIITFFVFIIFWYFEIEVLTESQVEFIRMYKFLLFYILVFYLLFIFLISCYNYYLDNCNNNFDIFSKNIARILKIINIIIMIKLIIYIFDINFEQYIQYTIWYLIYSLYRIILKLLGKKLRNEKFIIYTSYPFILILISFISLYLINKFDVNFKIRDNCYTQIALLGRKYIILDEKKKRYYIKIDLNDIFKK